MRGRHEHRTIDALLNEAEVLADDYDERDVAAMRERVLADLTLSTSEPGGTDGSASPADGTAGGRAARSPSVRAPRYSTECEQAAHDLDLAVSLVLNAPEAAASLSRFVEDEECAAPQGALVFGSLLHLARYREAAQFWWQFAAGGGSRTAAFCLYLLHRRHGEFRDAEYWRAHSERLPRRPRTEGLPRPRGGTRPLLPDGVLHGLLSECHGGGRPRLPHALESVIHRLPVTDDDEDFGEIPQPARDLTRRLTAPRPRH
ncbi:hypothetical protein H181DRAFT_04862 [Streptomyces sp. WMMB 714]|uniref:hypothetical protein n=1 Tax=Streptomyces sp. WMMB 714 TaxID=1286822 RepID=UPI0005F7F4F2|nr:hypothetical protein [Streptomyces sp. WMMB 714]SCK53312.1 hypothetical protein H181DRAFT_04862 [Streptomyces sp. WMMB 714]